MRYRDDSPPERRWPSGHTHTVYVERGDDEVEVACEMDEGSVWRARIAGTATDIELTADETQRACEDYAQSLYDAADAAREDDADGRADR